MSAEEFWPFYISQHMNRLTRRLHFTGTTLGLACLAGGIVSGDSWFFPAGLVLAYGFAWAGHFFVEKNRPATFKYPFLSFRADFRMYALMWRGGMEAEIARLKSDIQRHLATQGRHS